MPATCMSITDYAPIRTQLYLIHRMLLLSFFLADANSQHSRSLFSFIHFKLRPLLHIITVGFIIIQMAEHFKLILHTAAERFFVNAEYGKTYLFSEYKSPFKSQTHSI